ncbi:hypothetical protein HDU93_005127, partial [Gonapodya sp. JEL0774]
AANLNKDDETQPFYTTGTPGHTPVRAVPVTPMTVLPGSTQTIKTTALGSLVTSSKPVPKDLHRTLPEAGTPRATIAPDAQHPDGQPYHAKTKKDLSVLQQHAEFFDRDGDGVIWPWETFQGFRALNFNPIISLVAAVVIGFLGWWTQDSWFPHPLLPIYVKNIHRTKHGSDTEVYDTEGRFVPQKFEEIFSKYATTDPSGLYPKDLWRMVRGQRNVGDFVGWGGATFEWLFLWLLAKDENGMIPKESVRQQYDG